MGPRAGPLECPAGEHNGPDGSRGQRLRDSPLRKAVRYRRLHPASRPAVRYQRASNARRALQLQALEAAVRALSGTDALTSDALRRIFANAGPTHAAER